MIARHLLAGCVAALSGIAQAQSSTSPFALLDSANTNFTFTDCAAPDLMQSCWKAQNVTDDYDYSTDTQTCTGLEKRVQCALTNCWNRVYSCEYQQLIIQYNVTCTDDVALDLPFFPPPTDAVGACSCDLSKYLSAFYLVEMEMVGCANTYEEDHPELNQNDEDLNYDEDDDQDQDDDDEDTYKGPCDCCYYGAGASMMHDICPSTDPDVIRLDVLGWAFENQNITINDCPAVLSNFSCPNNGFESYGQNASAFAQTTLPARGTGSLTDMAGVMTSPVSAIYTWTAVNNTYTITAASTAAQATKTGSTGTASGTMSASGSASGTKSASPSSSSSSGQKLSHVDRTVVTLSGLMGLAFAMICL